ncbi:MAG: VOC family protein [Anaerolineales bacterium]|jgi:catechol 2,3-dioxygenase-like lactoylglutathione lyase family enzyme
MKPRIAVLSLWAEDVPKTAHFYRDVLELPMAAQHAQQPHFDLGGCNLVILKGRPSAAQEADPARFPLLALAVDNLHHAVERLKAHQQPLATHLDRGAVRPEHG